jgi:hypothetical protein
LALTVAVGVGTAVGVRVAVGGMGVGVRVGSTGVLVGGGSVAVAVAAGMTVAVRVAVAVGRGVSVRFAKGRSGKPPNLDIPISISSSWTALAESWIAFIVCLRISSATRDRPRVRRRSSNSLFIIGHLQ